ncbi:MAG: hypothetical protein QW273_02035 [Candidatus Pacearchaeota archaeon]
MTQKDYNLKQEFIEREKSLDLIKRDILSERNLRISNLNLYLENLENEKENVAYIDGRKIPLEYLCFHVGKANQTLLVPTDFYYSEKNKERFNLGKVFFSTTFKDLDIYFKFHEPLVVILPT